MRHEVSTVGNDAIEGAAGRQQFGFALGGDEARDQRIYGWVLHARVIARIFGVCCFTAENFCIFLSWVIAAAVGDGSDIKVKFL